jgi:signal transduction histidine kinase
VSSDGDAPARAPWHVVSAILEAQRRGEPVPDLFERALAAAEGALSADGSAVFLCDDTGALRVAAVRGFFDAERALGELQQPWQVGDPMPRPILVGDVTAVVHPATTWVAHRLVFEREGIRAFALLPLEAGDQLLGAFLCCYRQPRTFVPADAQLGLAIGRHVAACVEWARAQEREQQRAQESAVRGAISLALAGEEPLRLRLGACARLLCHSLGADQARIWLYKPNYQQLALEAQAGPGGAHGTAPLVVDLGDGVIGQVAVRQVPYLGDGGRFAACAARLGDQLQGVVALWSEQPMASSSISLLQAAAETMGHGIGRARNEAERERLLAETQRYTRMMEVFVGVLSHDLRNPLSAILTTSDLLARGEEVSRPAERIRQSAERMGRMIDQLLDFTRIRMGEGLPLDIRDMDLGALGRLVAGELEVAYPGRRIRLVENGGLWGAWDRDRLAQLLSNLGGNACQHGRDEATISIRLDGVDDDQVHIAVENYGAIPDQLCADLFEPGARRDASGGLGLGLYISQQIASAHGGTIDVHADPTADFTRITVTIPRRPLPDKPSGTFRIDRMPRSDID